MYLGVLHFWHGFSYTLKYYSVTNYIGKIDTYRLAVISVINQTNMSNADWDKAFFLIAKKCHSLLGATGDKL